MKMKILGAVKFTLSYAGASWYFTQVVGAIL